MEKQGTESFSAANEACNSRKVQCTLNLVFYIPHTYMKILLNAATHGDEKIGQRVIAQIKKLKLLKGEVIYTIANPAARKISKRFIDQDLNRSFPGKSNGNYEEKRAHELSPLIKSADVVFDIHSTTSSLKNAIIVTKLTPQTKKLISVIGPKYVLIMKVTKNNALISQAKVGIAFEYGKDTSVIAIKKTVEGIKQILIYLNMIKGRPQKNSNRPLYFEINKIVNKPESFSLLKNIQNYKLVKKGQAYAQSTKTDKTLTADEDFYPILFGEKKYKDYFGFAGTLV